MDTATHSDVTPLTAALGRIQAVCALVGFGKSHVLALVRAGRFPQPIKLGDRCTVWRLDEVRVWIEERTAEARLKAGES